MTNITTRTTVVSNVQFNSCFMMCWNDSSTSPAHWWTCLSRPPTACLAITVLLASSIAILALTTLAVWPTLTTSSVDVRHTSPVNSATSVSSMLGRIYLLTTHQAAWYIVRWCLSVCLSVFNRITFERLDVGS